jgi:hypothetical protein
VDVTILDAIALGRIHQATILDAGAAVSVALRICSAFGREHAAAVLHTRITKRVAMGSLIAGRFGNAEGTLEIKSFLSVGAILDTLSRVQMAPGRSTAFVRR